MAHPRKLIRDAVVALLTGAATAAGARVTATRVDPHRKSELPAISVYTLGEQVTASDTTPRELTRVARLEITAWVAHTAALHADDAMDLLAEQIEAAMDADPYLGGKAGDSVLEGTELAILDEHDDPLVGVVTLTYAVTYRTYVDDAVAVDDFLRAGVTHQLVGGVSDTVPAEDLVTVQETP